jgi:hypothetical protein
MSICRALYEDLGIVGVSVAEKLGINVFAFGAKFGSRTDHPSESLLLGSAQIDQCKF